MIARPRRSPALAALAGSLAGALLSFAPDGARAEVSRDLRTLPYRREIVVADSLRQARAWVEVREDELLAERSGPDFDDLRIVDESGTVIPALVREPRTGDHRLVRTGDAPWTSGVDENGRTWITIDIGGHPYDDLYVALPVPIEGPMWGSPDGKTWSAESGPMTIKPAMESGEPNLVRIGITFSRYLRVHVIPEGIPDRNVPITLYAGIVQKIDLTDVSFSISSSTFDDWTWRSVLELQGPPQALCRLSYIPVDGLRQRKVTLEARIEEGGWRFVPLAGEPIRGEEMVKPRPGEVPPEPSQTPGTLTWDPIRTGALRLTVEGADPPNAPITVTGIEAAPLRLAFPLPASGRVFVAYGDPFLGRPPQIPPGIEEALLDVRPAALGEEEPNPHHDPPGFGLEWLKRRPGVLTGLMVVVLAILALVVLKWRPERAGAGTGRPAS